MLMLISYTFGYTIYMNTYQATGAGTWKYLKSTLNNIVLTMLL